MSEAEKKELLTLKNQLFKGKSFVVFSDKEKDSVEYIRYTELLKQYFLTLSTK